MLLSSKRKFNDFIIKSSFNSFTLRNYSTNTVRLQNPFYNPNYEDGEEIVQYGKIDSRPWKKSDSLFAKYPKTNLELHRFIKSINKKKWESMIKPQLLDYIKSLESTNINNKNSNSNNNSSGGTKDNIFSFGVAKIQVDKSFILPENVKTSTDIDSIKKKKIDIERQRLIGITKDKMIRRKRFNNSISVKSSIYKFSENQIDFQSKCSTTTVMKTDPFQNYFNQQDLNNILSKDISNLDFKERIDLHLYSIHLQQYNSLFKINNNNLTIYDHLQQYQINNNYNNNNIIELVDNEDFIQILEIARKEYKENLGFSNLYSQLENRTLKICFKRLKEKKKFFGFFSMLENRDFNESLVPSDFTMMIQTLLELEMFDAAELLIENMLDFEFDIENQVLLEYLSYYIKKYPNQTMNQFTEFMERFRELSIHIKEVEDKLDKKIAIKKMVMEENGNEHENDDEEDDEIAVEKTIRDIDTYKFILKYLYKNNEMSLAELIEDRMETEQIYPDLDLFNYKIKTQVLRGMYLDESVVRSYSAGNQKALKGNISTIQSLLWYELITKKDYQSALNQLNRLKKKWNVTQLNSYTYHLIIYGLSRLGQFPLALQYLNEFQRVKPKTFENESSVIIYSLLLHSMGYYNQPSKEIIKLLDQMITPITTVQIDLIIHSYLLENKYKFNNNNNNQIDNLIEILNYLIEKKHLKLDQTSKDYIILKLKFLKLQYNIKPKKVNFDLIKNNLILLNCNMGF
ncbi:hypothetical protein DLAC_03134 [Tieghemostelium lacteum]|uniref:Pentatricopeptide repeat-containing protein n=1 Tax=Tieghemostelium lacteum TaxID=361077 RepID=A0A152A2D4_TIELA|nr:hypothetical protein DLAC_03134 [Tieghemostelium lacteum]|eukprot:KYR00386.1 hypothetical protein DLAC_03134 [Tieghemostelium lacteum]